MQSMSSQTTGQSANPSMMSQQQQQQTQQLQANVQVRLKLCFKTHIYTRIIDLTE